MLTDEQLDDLTARLLKKIAPMLGLERMINTGSHPTGLRAVRETLRSASALTSLLRIQTSTSPSMSSET